MHRLCARFSGSGPSLLFILACTKWVLCFPYIHTRDEIYFLSKLLRVDKRERARIKFGRASAPGFRRLNGPNVHQICSGQFGDQARGAHRFFIERRRQIAVSRATTPHERPALLLFILIMKGQLIPGSFVSGAGQTSSRNANEARGRLGDTH